MVYTCIASATITLSNLYAGGTIYSGDKFALSNVDDLIPGVSSWYSLRSLEKVGEVLRA